MLIETDSQRLRPSFDPKRASGRGKRLCGPSIYAHSQNNMSGLGFGWRERGFSGSFRGSTLGASGRIGSISTPVETISSPDISVTVI
jgi:hypothetical protein